MQEFPVVVKKIIIILTLSVLFFGGVYLFLKSNNREKNLVSETQRQPILDLSNAINGSLVEKKIAQSRPLAVIVENHPDSRPQFGLSKADLVYEALAEGGITRFLAIYQSQMVNEIGPVRSAREYFAEIANEWGALFAHVGGSNEVIEQIRKGVYINLDDANEYFNFEFFPRKKSQPEPHHIFTSTKKLQDLIQYHQYSNVKIFQPWQFKNDSLATTSLATKISIDFSRAGYEVGWEYDLSSNAYKRQQYFEPHTDALSGNQIMAKTVIVQIVDVALVPNDPLLSLNIDLKSGGQAIIFQDGMFVKGIWRKEAGYTRFFDLQNSEIKFNRGPIWLELVPKNKAQTLVW